jgi:hypothetical protein
MNKTFRNTLLVFAALVLAGAVFFAGNWFARANAFGSFNRMAGSRYPGTGVNQNGYGPGMMRGNGNMRINQNNNNGTRGMMGGNGGRMNGYGNNNANQSPISMDQAKTAAEKYLANLNNPDLKISEIMVFDNNAYILVKEISTGNGAFELLADSSSQTAYPEYGPNMMWNLKYGGMNHGGMMGGNGWNNTTATNVSAKMTVSSDQAINDAQAYLDTTIAGATAASDPITFYGYYTLDYEVNGKVAGMLSVNGYTGQVFLHTWHGNFIEESMIN